MLRIHFVILISVSFGCGLLISCAPSRMKENQKAQIQVELNMASLNPNSLASVISNDYCYALHATTPKDPYSLVMLNKQSGSDGGPKEDCPYQPIGPGTLSSNLVGPGGTLSIEINLGPDRRIDLMAIPKVLLGGSCGQSLSFAADPDEPERTQILIGGQDFDEDDEIKIVAVSPLVSIYPGENIVPLNVVTSDVSEKNYLCEGGGDESLRLVIPGQDSDGDVFTGMTDHFYMVSCTSQMSHVQMTIPDVTQVKTRGGASLGALSGGRYIVPCETRADFKGDSYATFGLVKHSGSFNGKEIKFQGLKDGVSVGVPKLVTIWESDQYRHLVDSSGSEISLPTSWDTTNNIPPKFAGVFRGGALGYQRLFVNNYSSSGSNQGTEAIEIIDPYGLGADTAEYSSIPSTSASSMTKGHIQIGSSLVRIQNSSGYQVQSVNGLTNGALTFSNLFGLHTNTPVATLSNGNFGLHIAEQSLGGSLYDCSIYLFGSALVSTTLIATSAYQCSNYRPTLFRRFSTSNIKVVSANKTSAQFEYYSTVDTGTTWTMSTKVLDAGGGSPFMDETRNALASTLVSVWKSSADGMKTKVAVHSPTGLSSFIGPSYSNFYPPWGYNDDKIYFVKGLNIDEIQGYTRSQLYLYDFSENDLMAGGYTTVGGYTRAVLYRSPDGGKNWYRVYLSTEDNTRAVSAIPIVLDYGELDNGSPYKRVGFAVLETNSSSAYRILIQNYMGY